VPHRMESSAQIHEQPRERVVGDSLDEAIDLRARVPK